jgi:hypothetical protein
MPYTNPWSDVAPPGSQAANTADDEFRKLRLDIHERLSGALVGPITDDPLIVRPEILGNVIGKNYGVHHSAFKPEQEWDQASGDSTFHRTALFVEHANTDASTRLMWAPLHLPPGITTALVTFLVNRNGVLNMNLKLLYTDFIGAPTSNVVASTSTSVNGISIINLAIVHVTTSNLYSLEVSFPGGQLARLYGAVVNYNTSDCRYTL